MAESTDSSSTFRQIRTWINDCSERHNRCQIPGPSDSERPTRLILVNHSAGTFQLTTDFPYDTKYAAVSYRWGSGKDCFMLTKETAEGMRCGLSMALLPKTLRDTCTIAHHIGLKYVWIDRLCIYQDSLEDWSGESSRMASIYKHAFITISAACASDENQGCFRKRDAAGIQPLRLFSNPLLPSSGPATDLHKTSYIISDESKEDRENVGKLGYLADRGWVFQERVLSKRIVHFAREEVHWECGELEASEAWPGRTESFSKPMRPSVLEGPGKEGLNWDEPEDWHGVVQEYSARELTYDSDKLPALSGLARETAELRKGVDDEYLAGLWRSSVLFDLYWEICSETLRMPEQYLAPSWSWASLLAKVEYPNDEWSGWYEYKPMAEVKDFRLRLATADAYGAVLDEWMHLSGHLKPVTVVREEASAEQSQRQGPCSVVAWDVNGSPFTFLNYSGGKLDIQSFAAGQSTSLPIFCLPILKAEFYHRQTEPAPPVVFCLLLVPNGSITHIRSGEALPSPETPFADEYQRAGLAQMTVNDWSAFKAWLGPVRDIVIR